MAITETAGSSSAQSYGFNWGDGEPAGVGVAAPAQGKNNPFSQNSDFAGAQGGNSDPRAALLQVLQGIGAEIGHLEQELGRAASQGSLSGWAGESAAAGAASAPATPNATGPAAAPSPTGNPPASAGAPSSAASQSVAIDGGNASGHGVVEQVDNNTGAAGKFGWENAQGKVVGELDEQNGQKGSFDVNADGADGKSARLIKLNPDGSVPAESNLDEQNVATNPDGSLQVSVDVSEITKGSDPTQIKITDGKGKSVGDGAPGGAYLYPTQDQETDTNKNPNTGALDPSNFYDNTFTN